MIRRPILAAALALQALSGCASTPQSDVPLTLYDTHAHFFSNDFAKYPIDTSASPEGDAALRARILAAPSTPERILPSWDAARVEGGAGVQYNSAYRTDNRYLLDVADRYPDRVSAVIILDPRGPDTPTKLAEMVRLHHVTGIRFTGLPDASGDFPWLDSDATVPTWTAASKLGVAIELMYLLPGANPVALDKILKLAVRFPKVRIVVDHIGWPADGGAPDYGLSPAHVALAQHRNIYFKFTSINLDRETAAGVSSSAFLRHAVDVFGADHIMWGSDFGNTQEPLPAMVSRALAAAALLTPRERRQVFHDTGKSVFGKRL